MIKSEVGGGTELHENVEEEPIEETQILVDNLKFEPNSGECHTFFLKKIFFLFWNENRNVKTLLLSKTMNMLQILEIAAAMRMI